MGSDWIRRYSSRQLLVLLVVGVSYYATGGLGLALAIGNSSRIPPEQLERIFAIFQRLHTR
jgi:hypothetical protein